MRVLLLSLSLIYLSFALPTIPSPTPTIAETNGFSTISFDIDPSFADTAVILYQEDPADDITCDPTSMNRYFGPVITYRPIDIAVCATGHPAVFNPSPITKISVPVTTVSPILDTKLCPSSVPAYCTADRLVTVTSPATAPLGGLVYVDDPIPGEHIEYTLGGPYAIYDPSAGISLTTAGSKTLTLRKVRVIGGNTITSPDKTIDITVTPMLLASSTSVTTTKTPIATNFTAEDLRARVPFHVDIFTTYEGAVTLQGPETLFRAHAYPLTAPGTILDSPEEVYHGSVAPTHDVRLYLDTLPAVATKMRAEGWAATATLPAPTKPQLVVVDIVPDPTLVPDPIPHVRSTRVFILQVPLSVPASVVFIDTAAVITMPDSGPTLIEQVMNDFIGDGITAAKTFIECVYNRDGGVLACNSHSTTGQMTGILALVAGFMIIFPLLSIAVGCCMLPVAHVSLLRAIMRLWKMVRRNHDKIDLKKFE